MQYRAGAFVILSTSSVLGHFIGGPAAYWLLGYGEWPTLLAATLLWIPIMQIAMMLPETLPARKDQEDLDAGGKAASFASQVWSKARGLSATTVTSMREMFWENPKLGILLISGLSLEVGRYVVSGILPQYMTKRYELAWREVRFISTLYALTPTAVAR